MKTLTQKEFSEFTLQQFKKQSKTQKEIAVILGNTQPAVSNALKKSDHENSRYNGTRKDLLKLFGYEAKNLIGVIKK